MPFFINFKIVAAKTEPSGRQSRRSTSGRSLAKPSLREKGLKGSLRLRSLKTLTALRLTKLFCIFEMGSSNLVAFFLPPEPAYLR